MNSQPNSNNASASAEIEATASAGVTSSVSDQGKGSNDQRPVGRGQSTNAAPKPGVRTTQFWLLAGVLALVAWMVFAEKLDAGWFAVLAPIVVLVYQGVRESLYRDAQAHPTDALDHLLETVLSQLPAPTGADATMVIAALKGGAVSRDDGKKVKDGTEVTNGSATAESGFVQVTTLGAIALVSAVALLVLAFCAGCAQTPYYISGVDGVVDTSKDMTRITGGELQVNISPNPRYPMPKQDGK